VAGGPQAATRRHSDELSPLLVRQAVALGLIQGPAELLPVSSSGHLVLLPALLDWPYARLDADVRKTFEVALHAGAGVALAWVMRDAVVDDLRDPAGTIVLVLPAAVAAVVGERWIESRASSARVAAGAQLVSGAALAVVDRTASAKGRRDRRGRPLRCRVARSARESAESDPYGRKVHSRGGPARLGALFAVAVAQTLALVPGVSRNGATMTAARALGCSRAEAVRLSWRAGLPVIGGAVALKGARVLQRGLDPALRRPFAAGAATAFVSALAAAPLARLATRSWAPIAAYRVALGALALRRLHRLQ
jgi:undecaprenyl-diphosphatase